MPKEVPPLRRRGEDIPLLVDHSVARCNERTGKHIRAIDAAALGRLVQYDWLGNVRELENAIERAFVRCRGEVLLSECLPALEPEGAPGPVGAPRQEGARADANERARVLCVLQETRRNRPGAAARLGVHRPTLWRRMREWGLDRPGVAP